MLAFRAIDREEDRPHTLEWLISQAVAGLAAIVGIMMFLSSSVRQDADDKGARLMLVMIPILINGVGDGLAEPVGIRFGKHKYKTRALWYQGRCCSGSFTRSFEVRGVYRADWRIVRHANDPQNPTNPTGQRVRLPQRRVCSRHVPPLL